MIRRRFGQYHYLVCPDSEFQIEWQAKLPFDLVSQNTLVGKLTEAWPKDDEGRARKLSTVSDEEWSFFHPEVSPFFGSLYGGLGCVPGNGLELKRAWRALIPGA